ncbi:unnamed protein product [Ostreobium quekettii]|uniref:protein O-GlcNAc transferase n=1 Tax=Ostreobium quekettii TaxID=121088 RepID=A0A8S1IZI4_9CHLO|nr:unnamed protein product [Ostreobium quekettii]
MALLQASVQACPTYAEAYNNIGVVQRDVALVEEAIGSYEKCLQLCPGSRNAGQNRLLALNYIFPGEDGRVCKAHSEWGEEFERTMQPLPPVSRSDWDTNPNRVLRVGYISPDLYTHSVAFFADAPLSHHNQEAVKHVVYSCVPQADANTARLRQAVQKAGGEWKDVVHLSERQLAGLVRQDKIDVLVELSGHTANNRLGTMALRPAPIQVTWIGYPNSTGLRSVDYRFTDVNCDPVSTRQTFTEELVRLPGCFLCYTPLVNPPPVAAAPCVRNGFITFGSFNGLAKITPEVIKLWCRILLSVPSARFVLKQKPLVCETTKAHLLQLFAAEGIESWRVDLLPAIPQTYDHLAMYSLMDVSLDPFPYAGTTTTCESLFMGVPCLTLKGHCHAHNVGVSLVRAVGLEEHWLASTQEEYLQLAVEASQDFERLEELRSGLRDRMLKSPLCDAPAFMPKLESTYRSLWTRWLKQSGEGGDCVSLEPSQMPHKRKNSNELELQRKASREGTQVETSPEQGC